MSQHRRLSSSLEDYLEAIFHIEAHKRAARAKDIAQRLRVKASSVTGALRLLAERGLVNYQPYGLITLTPDGLQTARDIVLRHEALYEFFTNVLGMGETAAQQAACGMEHAMSRPVLERFVQFIDFTRLCPRMSFRAEDKILERCRNGSPPDQCKQCVTRCLDEIKRKITDRTQRRGATTALADLRPGERGRVVAMRRKEESPRWTHGVDVAPGALVEVEQVYSRGNRIGAKIKGRRITLAEQDAVGITVEVL